ncbi:hypothetical protein JIN85_20990, partial [Luteolibacter pohnpeiensis]
MAEELYDSFLQLTWDAYGAPTRLVSVGDPLWGGIEINGGQTVDEVPYTKAAGIRALPLGNERNQLKFERCVIHDSVVAAFSRRLKASTLVPRNGADLHIQSTDGYGFLLKNAAIRSWPTGQLVDGQPTRFTREGLEIIGGSLVMDQVLQTVPRIILS